jgi:putative FmdB family regulatory protein
VEFELESALVTMPIYEYTCKECGHRFEILQRLGEGAEGLACPKCDAENVEKQFSTFASSSSDGSSSFSTSGGCGSGGFT